MLLVLAQNASEGDTRNEGNSGKTLDHHRWKGHLTHLQLAGVIKKIFCMEESSATAYPKQGVCFTCSLPCRVLPLLFCADKPLTEITKYFWFMLVHRTRECVDRQKLFNCSQVAFLNPQPLTFKKSLTTVSTESTSITVLGKKNGKPKTRVCPFWKLAVHIFCSAFNKLLIKEDFQGFPNMVSSLA